MALLHILSFFIGLALVVIPLRSAIRTFVLPRSARDWLTYAVFLNLRRVFLLFGAPTRPYEKRDRVMSFYAPVGLLCLPFVWVAIVTFGYMFMYRAFGLSSWRAAYTLSGSSLLTLGFAVAPDFPTTVLVFTEAALGLLIVALLIAYLPTIYGTFSKREVAVTLLEVRAGSPPSAIEMLLRFQRLGRLDKLNELWTSWETWFAELEETHTSFAVLAFFRSSQPDHSWVTASGAVLDAASLFNSALDLPRDPQADLCIRAGFLALRRIADYFLIPYTAIPSWEDPISVTRGEYDAAFEELAQGGLPMKTDREKAWRDFVGWRVNYDAVLLALATLTIAPYAPWSSDRARVPHRGAPGGVKR